MTELRPLLALSLVACSAAPPNRSPPVVDDHDPRRAALAFLDAAEAGRFESCYRLLSGRERARYTPERLAEDFQVARASARERLTRARIALERDAVVEGDRASFPIGRDKAVRLVREDDRWRVDSLD